MKNVLISLLAFLSIQLYAQNYEISRWYEGKHSAIIPTFDDGTADHPGNAIPILNEYGFQGTFYVNASQNYNWHKAALADGHEIGNHTKSHPHLLELTSEQLKTEIGDFKKTLVEKTGSQVLTLAYPFGEGSETQSFAHEVQDSVAKHHIAGRGVYSYQINGFPYNFAPTPRHYYQLHTLSVKADNLFSMIDQCTKEGGILPLMYHGVGAPGVFENVSIEEFRSHLDHLASKKDSVWITSLANAISYHRERKGAVLQQTSAPFVLHNNWTLQLTDTLRDDWYNFPLSIVLEIPDSITAITGITQNNKAIEFTIENDTVYFNAVPDGGDIILDILNCEQPNAPLSITGKSTFCLPDSLLFEFPYNENYSYSWYKDGELTTIDTNFYVAKTAGEYYAKVELNGCPLTTPKTTVNITGTCGIPITDFTVNVSQQFKGVSVFFTSTSANLEGTETYYWNFGEGASLSPGIYGPGPVEVSYSIGGNKEVSLKVQGRVNSVTTTKTNILSIEEFTPCHAFKNDFNDGYNKNFFGGWNNYSFSTQNDALRITTQSSGHQWHTMDYAFNDGTSTQIIDFSDPLVESVLKIRIKASDTCRVAVSLVDNNGVATVGSKMNKVGGLDITAEYQEFELNFSGLFFQQWEGKDVDSTKIEYIRFAVNQGFKDYPFVNKYGVAIDKHFHGKIDIDWLSLGKDCEFEPLEGSIILPESICLDSIINFKNVSNPAHGTATYDWSFGENASPIDTSLVENEIIPVSFSTTGNHTVNLTVTNGENKTTELTETINVKECAAVGLEENASFSVSFQNPITSTLNGTIESFYNTHGDLYIVNMKGQTFLSKNITLHKGENAINVQLTDLNAGTYQAVFISEQGSFSTLLIKN